VRAEKERVTSEHLEGIADGKDGAGADDEGNWRWKRYCECCLMVDVSGYFRSLEIVKAFTRKESMSRSVISHVSGRNGHRVNVVFALGNIISHIYIWYLVKGSCMTQFDLDDQEICQV
jgi:hypothetical protein